MEATSDSQLRDVKLWDTRVTVRLMALEQQEQREVFIAKTNQSTMVANVICCSDSGEQLKVVLWGDHVANYYDLFLPNRLLELTSFKATPAREGKFRVGNMHFELGSQQSPNPSTVRVLRSNYKLQGPSKSYASVVASNVPGRHKIHVRVLDKFVKSGDTFLGPVEMEDFTVEQPLKIIVTLQEVFAIERHRLVRGQEITLVGTVEARGSTFYMNVLSWSDVSFVGEDDDDDSEKPSMFGHSRSVGFPKSNEPKQKELRPHRPSVSKSIESKLKDVKPQRPPMPKKVEEPATRVCPVLYDFSTVADLESADLLKNPWHLIGGEISEPIELREHDHCGELLMDEEDGACMTVRIRLRCVPKSKEGYLGVGTKCSVKGYVRKMFDGELELEARWGDFEFANEPFSEPQSEDEDDSTLAPFLSAMDLKQLLNARRIRIRGTLVKKFEDAGDRYIGVIKVKDMETQCVRVHFDWSQGDEEPQEHILAISSGAEVEVAGWAERKDVKVFMAGESIQILRDALDTSGLTTPGTNSSANMTFTFDTPKDGGPVRQEPVPVARKKEYVGKGRQVPRQKVPLKAESVPSSGVSSSGPSESSDREEEDGVGGIEVGSAANSESSEGKNSTLPLVTPKAVDPKSVRSGRKAVVAAYLARTVSPKHLRPKRGATKDTACGDSETPFVPVEEHGSGLADSLGLVRPGAPEEVETKLGDEKALVSVENDQVVDVPKNTSKPGQKSGARKRKSSSKDAALPVTTAEDAGSSKEFKSWAKGKKSL